MFGFITTSDDLFDFLRRRLDTQREKLEAVAAIADALIGDEHWRAVAQLRDTGDDAEQRRPNRRGQKNHRNISCTLGQTTEHCVVRNHRRACEITAQRCLKSVARFCAVRTRLIGRSARHLDEH